MRADSVGRIGVAPLDGLGVLVVALDVAHELPRKILHRGEDATSDDVPLDLRKPVLDLIEPGRVGRSEVEMDSRVIREEALYVAALVDRKVVQDDVDLLLSRHAAEQAVQEGHEGRAVVLLDGHTVDVARARIQRRVKRQSSVSVVLEAVAFQPSRRERAWSCVFSSKEKTAACWGGFK